MNGIGTTKFKTNPVEVTTRIKQGFQCLALSSDAGFLSKAARAEFSPVDFIGEAEGSTQEAKGSLY